MMLHAIGVFLTMIVAAILLALLAACSVISYENGPVRFSRSSFGTDTEIQGLRVTVGPDGTRTFDVDGVTTQQTQALEAVARGAAQGAAKAP